MALLVVLLAALSAWNAAAPPAAQEAAAVPQVLVISSYGGDFAPYNALSSQFRSGLAQEWAAPVGIREVVLDVESATAGAAQDAFADYLRNLLAGHPPDLVVAIAGPAAVFMLAQQAALLPATPLLLVGADTRFVDGHPLAAGVDVVPITVDVPGLVGNILEVLPTTERVAVLIGTSPIERFWRTTLERDLRPFEDRLTLQWWDDLSLPQMVAAAAELPENSAVLFTLLLTDAAGVPHNADNALAQLHASSTAPIFGVFDTQVGRGIVGGQLLSVPAMAEQAIQAAVRILRGEPAADTRPVAVATTRLYDGRELRRWGIDAGALPEGGEVLHEVVSPWRLYRGPIIAAITTIAVMAAMLVGLNSSRARRAAAERDLRDLSHRLLKAMEDDRRWLGRELHDDISQRLARLAIDVARLDGSAGASTAATTASIRQSIAALSNDIRGLSHWLRPSILDDLGLVEALRAEVARARQAEALAVEAELPEHEARLHPDTALCLYRIAQEALRNAARHARAQRVTLTLRPDDGGCQLEVRDDGVGFELGRERGQGIGLTSMSERVRLVGGKLTVESQPGHGTTVRAWVPRDGVESA